MCDFKPGDEVEVVKVGPQSGLFIAVGQQHTIREVSPMIDQYGRPHNWADGEALGVKLVGIKAAKPGSVHTDAHFHPSLFRKVQKRNDRLTLEAFFTVPGGFEEPKRTPAKRRERA